MQLKMVLAMRPQLLEDMSIATSMRPRSIVGLPDRRWEKLNEMAARAHAALVNATRFGVHDGNAAEVLRLQVAADTAEAALLRLERRQLRN